MKKILCLFFTVILIFTTALPVNVSATISNKTISLMGIIDEDGADRTSWIPTAASYLQNINNNTISQYTAFNVNDFLTQISNQDMLVVHTHGSQTSIKTVKNNSSVSLTTTMLDNVLYPDACEQLRICYLGACNCGLGGSTATNLVNTIYDHSALCVIGYTASVNTQCNRKMLERFCHYIGVGNTVNYALASAENDVFNLYGVFGNVNSRLVRGVSTISMTDASYKSIGTTSYNLSNYDQTTVSLNSNSLLSSSDNTLCTTTGDVFKFNENNEIYSYINVSNESNTNFSIKFIEDTFFSNFDTNNYKKEYIQCNDNITTCMRAHINGIKTNDIIYYTLDNNEHLLSYGYPRPGNAKAVQEMFSSISYLDISEYVNDIYNISIIDDIIIDVNDVNNPIINILYTPSNCECQDMFCISLSSIIQ